MPHQDKLRADFLAFIDTLPKRVGETPESVIFDWFLAHTIPKKEVREVIGSMKRPFIEDEGNEENNLEIQAVNAALSDLATRLGIKQ